MPKNFLKILQVMWNRRNTNIQQIEDNRLKKIRNVRKTNMNSNQWWTTHWRLQYLKEWTKREHWSSFFVGDVRLEVYSEVDRPQFKFFKTFSCSSEDVSKHFSDKKRLVYLLWSKYSQFELNWFYLISLKIKLIRLNMISCNSSSYFILADN